MNKLTKDSWKQRHSDVGLFIQTDNFILWRLLSTKDAVDPILGMASLTIVEAPGKPMSADLRLSPSMKKKR